MAFRAEPSGQFTKKENSHSLSGSKYSFDDKKRSRAPLLRVTVRIQSNSQKQSNKNYFLIELEGKRSEKVLSSI